VHQGEQITVVYKIYTRARIVNYSINKLPTMTGFWGEELQLPQQVNLTNEVVNGKQYQVGILRKMALFPTQNGVLEINPMELTVRCRFNQNGGRMIFLINSLMIRSLERKLQIFFKKYTGKSDGLTASSKQCSGVISGCCWKVFVKRFVKQTPCKDQ